MLLRRLIVSAVLAAAMFTSAPNVAEAKWGGIAGDMPTETVSFRIVKLKTHAIWRYSSLFFRMALYRGCSGGVHFPG